MGGLGGEDGRVPRSGRAFVHGVAAGVKGVKAGIGEPGFVEVHPRGALSQELDDAVHAVAKAVVGRVGDDGVHRRLRGGAGGEWARRDGVGDGLGRKAVRRDGPDEAVAVARGHEVDRDGTGDGKGVVDRLVAVAVRQHDVTGHDAGMGDDLVRGRGPVQHEVGGVCPEDPGGVALRLPDDPGVVEQ